MRPRTDHIAGLDVVERAERAARRLQLAEPDWPAVTEVLARRSLRRSVVTAALGLVAACGELDEADEVLSGYVEPEDHVELEGYFDIAPYMNRVFTAETAVLRCLRLCALLGREDDGHTTRRPRTIRPDQVRKTRKALTSRSYLILTMERPKGARECAQIGMGLVQHQVSGAALPAVCSTGEDW